ncbi:acyltransferase [Metabacillus idriensis]|uniref:acyltransferase n=1 Tax=Metabacillus idriensis TaxID=324768 RepID=UPI00174A655B|nr:acyltransferase [Metabacillus idriensis]
MIPRKPISQLNIVRAVAMIAVVLIHATAPAFGRLEPQSDLYWFYMFLNRFSRFSVPLFIFVSGLVLFYNYYVRENTFESWKKFYKKRLSYILIPYLMWSAFYLIYMMVIDTKSPVSINELRIDLLFGLSKYHLYYIAVLIQFYFVFPFILKAVQKVAILRGLLFILGFIIQFYLIDLNQQMMIFQHQGSIVFSYIGYFLFGAWFGIYYEKIMDYRDKLVTIVSGVLTLILGIAHAQTYYLSHIGQETVPVWMFNFIFAGFSVASGVFLLKISLKSIHLPNKFTDFLNVLGHYSFGIYLIHPFVLDVFDKMLNNYANVNIHLFVFSRFFFALFISLFLVYLIIKLVKFSWIIFGSTSYMPLFDKKNKE